MSAVADRSGDTDVTDVPWITLSAMKLGLLEAVLVLLFSLASRFLDGFVETLVCAVILLVGLAAVTMLPGLWTRARTVEGIAGAAGIGLGAAFVFLLVDVALLQNIGIYTHRWLQVGGGSNWWYHPVWWMVGSFLPWMGAWILANQSSRRGAVSPGLGFGIAVLFAIVLAVIAILVGFPGARWTLATFGVAFLPGVAAAVLVSGMGTRPA